MAKEVVVEIDSREKNPLQFPSDIVFSTKPYHRQLVRVQTRRVELAAGDYRLARYPKACVIERKSGIDELAKNLLDPSDRVRFTAAWDRFLNCCQIPVLLLDASLAASNRFKGLRSEKIGPEDVMAAFWEMVWRAQRAHGLTLVWVGNTVGLSAQHALGTQVLRMMLSAAQHKEIQV